MSKIKSRVDQQQTRELAAAAILVGLLAGYP